MTFLTAYIKPKNTQACYNIDQSGITVVALHVDHIELKHVREYWQIGKHWDTHTKAWYS